MKRLGGKFTWEIFFMLVKVTAAILFLRDVKLFSNERNSKSVCKATVSFSTLEIYISSRHSTMPSKNYPEFVS